MALSIYKSSAGSGKTYTLAKEYIKLLLQNPLQHPHILAVTFTNKATQEMKERIIKFLINLSKNEDDNLLQMLKAETGYAADHIKANSKKALQQILHNYGDFTIVTIDSFFNRLIKSFAHELKLPLRMEVQLDSDEALEDAYDRLMLQLGIDKDLAKYITNYMFHKLDNDKGWYVEREIKDLGKQLFRESFDSVFKSLAKVEFNKIKELIEDTNNYLSRINNQIKDLGNEWFEHLDGYGLKVEDFSYGKGGVGNFGNHLLDVRTDKLGEPGIRVLSALDNLEKWHKKKHPKSEEIQECASNHLIDIINNALQIWQEVKAEYNIRLMLFKNLHALGLLKNINEHLKSFRDENDRILISDQNRLINEIISQSDVPFLYEKTGAKYRHFLLDEFQDTSALQWINFKPLLENALAEGGKVLVVGDGKQSIYRWRGGKMELLLKNVSEDLAHFADENSIQNLDANFRSRKEIIDFNNQFFNEFAKAAAKKLEKDESPLAQLAFADVEQKSTPQTKTGGYVEMQFIDDLKEEYIDDAGKKKKEVIEKAKEIVDEKLIETVKSLKDENYNWRDMACLVFTNSQGARVAELLTKNNIPVQSSDSLLLKNSYAVRLLISMLRHLQNPEDALRRGEVILMLAQLNSLEFLVSSPESKEDEIEESASRLSKAEAELHTNLQKAKSSTQAFYDLLPETLNATLQNAKGSLLHQVNELIKAAELEDHQPEYIQRFTEIVYNYEIKNESHLGEFLDWWDETAKNHSIQTPENEDAVVILTIHRAKGLQYPVVLMPYAKRGIDTKSSDIMWLKNTSIDADWLDFLPLNYTQSLLETPYEQDYLEEKELAMVDALNMLYVAFTRPEERLYVLAEYPKPQKKPEFQKAKYTTDFLYLYLKDHSKLSPYFEGDTLVFGNKTSPEKRKVSESKSLDSLIKTNSQAPLLRKPRLQIADLRSGKVKPFQKGILLHELLAQVNSKADISKCLQLAVADGMVNETEVEIWTEKLVEVLDNEQIKQWTEDAIEQLNEQEFLTPNGALRPDKIYVLPDRIIVLDYKTGKPKPEHDEQVLQYLDVVSSLEFEVSNSLNQEGEIQNSKFKIQNSGGQADLFNQELAASSLKLEAYLLYTQTNQLVKVN
ncbi:MAG: UvrD-helicase domain-containing protein [Bacteroidia bacterium]